MSSGRKVTGRVLFDPAITRRALIDAFAKLNPRVQIRNPVMFVVWVGAVFTSGLTLQALIGVGETRWTFILAISLWLWFTLVFANFAEALAEGRGKAQAESLRKTRRDVVAKRLSDAATRERFDSVPAPSLRK